MVQFEDDQVALCARTCVMLWHAVVIAVPQVLDSVPIRDPFIRNWLDLLSFLLSGLPADGTIAAEVAFMFNE